MNERSVSSDAMVGAIAGFVATLPMTLVMLLLHRLLPSHERQPLPPEQMAHRFMGVFKRGRVSRTSRRSMAIPLHFGFGAAAGALYGVTAGRAPAPPVASAVPFALLVWLVSYLGWIPAANILPPAHEQPGRRNALMIVAHVVWGSATGSIYGALSGR